MSRRNSDPQTTLLDYDVPWSCRIAVHKQSLGTNTWLMGREGREARWSGFYPPICERIAFYDDSGIHYNKAMDKALREKIAAWQSVAEATQPGSTESTAKTGACRAPEGPPEREPEEGSVFILGWEDKATITQSLGASIGKASVRRHCIWFECPKGFNAVTLEVATRYGGTLVRSA